MGMESMHIVVGCAEVRSPLFLDRSGGLMVRKGQGKRDGDTKQRKGTTNARITREGCNDYADCDYADCVAQGSPIAINCY